MLHVEWNNRYTFSSIIFTTSWNLENPVLYTITLSIKTFFNFQIQNSEVMFSIEWNHGVHKFPSNIVAPSLNLENPALYTRILRLKLFFSIFSINKNPQHWKMQRFRVAPALEKLPEVCWQSDQGLVKAIMTFGHLLMYSYRKFYRFRIVK